MAHTSPNLSRAPGTTPVTPTAARRDWRAGATRRKPRPASSTGCFRRPRHCNPSVRLLHRRQDRRRHRRKPRPASSRDVFRRRLSPWVRLPHRRQDPHRRSAAGATTPPAQAAPGEFTGMSRRHLSPWVRPPHRRQDPHRAFRRRRHQRLRRKPRPASSRDVSGVASAHG